MTQFKAMKFRVESPEHSEKIQKKLFEMGYKWYGEDDTALDFQSEPFLFTEPDDGTIGWASSADEGFFIKDPNQEMQLVEITTYDFVPVPKNTPEKDVVMFDGKEYDKEQFKELLKEALDKL
jgi:hypothetical protein